MAAQYSYAEISDHPSVGPLAAPMPRVPRIQKLRLAIAVAFLVCLAAAFVSLGSMSLWPVSLGSGSRARPVVRTADGRLHRLSAATLLRLPTAAQAPISAALGGEEAAYRISGLRALNPAQRMRLRFSTHGVTLSSGATRLTLSLAGVGRGEALRPEGTAVPLVASNRVSYTRGALREWYVNGPLGLEQGFDLARRPAGRGALTLAVALSGASGVRLHDGSALLSVPGGTLRYGGLSATDAGGHPLHAWLGLGGGRLLIHVDDRGARYPVRIDPFVEQGELTGGGEVGAGQFGYSVALSADGNTALIGGPADNGSQGAAWVFTRTGGLWMQDGSKLVGAGESGAGMFGSSVALSADGNTALIGGEADGEGAGAAWVFTCVGGIWTQQGSKLTGGTGSGAGFGVSVALSADGDTALIGAPGYNEDQGAAWTFARSGEAWAPDGSKFVGGAEIGAGLFGFSVALNAEGTQAVVGGPGDDGGVGAAWVSRCGASGCGEEAKLTGEGAVGSAGVGFSVAIAAAKETVLVGAPDDRGGEGSAWVFQREPIPPLGAWVAQQKLTVLGRKHLGDSVALSAEGNIAILGGSEETGVWEFGYGSGGWTDEGQVLGGSPVVALSGDADTLLAGGDLNNGKVGAAAVLLRAPEAQENHPPESPSSPPPRHFALGRETVLADGAVQLEVEVPGPGVLSAAQVPAVATEDSVNRSTRRGRSTKRPRAGEGSPDLVQGIVPQVVEGDATGTVVVFRPTADALRELARKRALAVPVQVSFTPTGGQASVSAARIDFTKPEYSFEGGNEGWESAWGDLTVGGTTAHHHSGRHSLQITIHSDPYAAVNVTASSVSGDRLGLLQSGVPISMWVYRPSSTPPVGFRALVRVGEEWTECRSAEVRPRANRWVRLSVTVPGSASCKSSGAANPEVHGVGVEIDDRGGVAKGKNVYLEDVNW